MWSSTNHASRTHQFWPLPYMQTCERRSGMWGSRANCLNILEVCVMCTWQKESGNSSLTAAAAEPQTTSSLPSNWQTVTGSWHIPRKRPLSLDCRCIRHIFLCAPKGDCKCFLYWYQIQKAGFHQRFRSNNYFCYQKIPIPHSQRRLSLYSAQQRA